MSSPLLPDGGHDLGGLLLLCLRAVEKLAAGALGHHVSPGEARELAETVGTVDDRPARGLGVPEHEVGVWETRRGGEGRGA